MLSFEDYKERYRLTLSPEQETACRTVDGHVLLLAVPGSGKTTVMIARLGYMIRGLGIDPGSILAVTYSVAGAREMQRRYEALFGKADVEIRTIHGFCAALIRRYERIRGTTAFRLADGEGEVTQMLRSVMEEAGYYPSENELRDVKTAVTFCRNGLLTDGEISSRISIEGIDFPAVYRRYQAFKRERRVMDYDYQLVYGHQILRTCPEVRASYADRFRYFCVDEAQDTSRIQHEILRFASRESGNLFMVGDEDQSIYGFRAAFPEALLSFDTDYPDARILSIGCNYRSTGRIVAAAGAFIALNRDRRGGDKRMTTDNPAGEPIRHTVLPDRRLLGEHIRRTAEAVRDGREGSVAVLCRLNDSLLPLIDLLSETGVPYRVRGGDSLFFSHFIVEDVAAILRFAADPFDPALFRQLYYKFSCGISRTDCETALRENSGPGRLSFPDYLAETSFFPESVRKRAGALSRRLAAVNRADTYEAIRLILSSGYGRYLARRTRDPGKTAALLAIAERHRSRDAFFRRLQTLEETVRRGSEKKDGILLSTIHSAKGMEFDRVILCDCRDGILPTLAPAPGKAMTKEEEAALEEERRLFYVGVTRAKTGLELVTWDREFGETAEPFSFVSALLKAGAGPEKPPEKPAKPSRRVRRARRASPDPAAFREGAAVIHRVFGYGVIVGRRGDLIQVRFTRYTFPKKLELSVCLAENLLELD